MVYRPEPYPDKRVAGTVWRTVLAVLLTVLVVSLLSIKAVMAQVGNDEVTLTIVGRVVDSQGQRVDDAEVAVLLNGHTEAAAHGTSQIDGTFVVDLPLPEGATTVLVIKVTRPHFEPLEWQAGAGDVARLNAGQSVRLPDLELARRLTPGFWIATLTFVAILVLIALEKLHNTMAALLGVAVVLGTSFVGGAFTPDLFIFDFERALQPLQSITAGGAHLHAGNGPPIEGLWLRARSRPADYRG